MTNRQVKEDIIAALFERGVYTKQVNDTEFRTRCPFCGDSQKNFNTGHLYIRINVDDNFPIVYNCFKCNESGIVNEEFLTVMDINNSNLKSSIIRPDQIYNIIFSNEEGVSVVRASSESPRETQNYEKMYFY